MTDEDVTSSGFVFTGRGGCIGQCQNQDQYIEMCCVLLAVSTVLVPGQHGNVASYT